MTFYQLAIRYLIRKKGKSILLFFVLLFVSSMILSAAIILRAFGDSEQTIQAKTGSKVIVEITDQDHRITKEELRQISSLDDVAFVNRSAHASVLPDGFVPITNSLSDNEDNQKAAVISYDQLEKDSAFSEGQYHLTKGEYIGPDTVSGAVVNALLADANGLAVGDALGFITEDGTGVTTKSVGLFRSGNEQKQTSQTDSVHRIENQIFIDNATYAKLFGSHGYDKAAVYTRHPQKLASLRIRLESMLQDKAAVTASDLLYKQLKAPLDQAARVIRLMLILSTATGIIVVSLLLCMWMRSRRKEAAIYISMGRSKGGIFLQALIEAFAVLILAAAGACALGSFLAKALQTLFISNATPDIALETALQASDVLSLLGLGGLIILIAVTIAAFPILRANPKDTLAKMEG